MCEEYTLNILHNGGEKKDEKVDTFTLEVPADLLYKLNYVQYQLGSLLVYKLQEDEACYTLACSARDTLNDAIMYLEKQVQKGSQKSD